MADRKFMRASFTVEAAIIVPFILFTMVSGISIGYGMFSEAKQSAEIQEELIKLDPIKIVRRNTLVREVAK